MRALVLIVLIAACGGPAGVAAAPPAAAPAETDVATAELQVEIRDLI